MTRDRLVTAMPAVNLLLSVATLAVVLQARAEKPAEHPAEPLTLRQEGGKLILEGDAAGRVWGIRQTGIGNRVDVDGRRVR